MNQTSIFPMGRAEAARQRYLTNLQKQASKTGSRPVDNVLGKEVVTQSSKKPLVLNPPLGVTPKDLSNNRADTHRRLAHSVSHKIAYATGAVDGITDGLVNGVAEIFEDGVFLISKIIHGAQHGWQRGKFPNIDQQ